MKLSASPKTFWQTTFAFTFIVNLVILIWSISRWVELKVIIWRSIWVVPLVLYLAVLIGCVFLFIRMQKGGAEKLIAALELTPFNKPWVQVAGAVLFAGILWAIPWLKFTFRVGEVVKKSTQDPVLTMIVFYWAVWWLVLLAAAALKVAFKTSWSGGFAAALVILGVAYEFFVRAHEISSYPFSLGWSETSRFYYGSLYFSQSVYGEPLALSSLHPSRYLLQSLAFLVPGAGLEFSRLWQVILWVGLTGAAALILVHRVLPSEQENQRPHNTQSDTKGLKPVFLRDLRGQNSLRWLLAGWLFLFLLRVGVYYHLEIMVILPLLFVSAKHPWRSLAAVVIASAWAGISRVNWFPMPGLLAVAIYLLEERYPRSTQRDTKENQNLRDVINYLKQPILWMTAGLVIALTAQALYIPLSGNASNAGAFASSFSSDLLWERLWPNDSYPLGVLTGILIVSGPLLVALLRSKIFSLHPIRWLGLLAALTALFAGGLVVSVKIGGGGDLHNMDAYAVFLSLLAAYFVGEKVQGESDQPTVAKTLPWPVTAIALLIPLIFLIPALSPLEQADTQGNQNTFNQLKTLVAQAKGPVLFINERHLVTFKQVDVALVPEYEAVTLMEMAMSNNQPYLQRFYADLQNHRFAAIVSGKQNVGTKEEGPFADENNIWNTRVSPYILCYYEPAAELEASESKIEFYVPRAPPGICP